MCVCVCVCHLDAPVVCSRLVLHAVLLEDVNRLEQRESVDVFVWSHSVKQKQQQLQLRDTHTLVLLTHTTSNPTLRSVSHHASCSGNKS